VGIFYLSEIYVCFQLTFELSSCTKESAHVQYRKYGTCNGTYFTKPAFVVIKLNKIVTSNALTPSGYCIYYPIKHSKSLTCTHELRFCDVYGCRNKQGFSSVLFVFITDRMSVGAEFINTTYSSLSLRGRAMFQAVRLQTLTSKARIRS